MLRPVGASIVECDKADMSAVAWYFEEKMRMGAGDINRVAGFRQKGVVGSIDEQCWNADVREQG